MLWIDAIRTRLMYRRLARAGTRLRARGVRLFPRGPDGLAESWYIEASARHDELRTIGFRPMNDSLRELWQQQDLPELADLADDLGELATQLECPDDTAEVSPFIYAMF